MGRAKVGDKDLFFPGEKELLEFQRQHDLVLERHPNFIQDILEIKEMTRKNCGAISSQVSINVNGEIKLCNMDGGYFKLEMGNVISRSIKEVFDDNKEFLGKFMDVVLPTLDSDDCISCEQNVFCTNCLLRGFLAAKTLHKIGRTCNWYQKIDPIVKKRFPIT